MEKLKELQERKEALESQKREHTSVSTVVTTSVRTVEEQIP